MGRNLNIWIPPEACKRHWGQETRSVPQKLRPKWVWGFSLSLIKYCQLEKKVFRNETWGFKMKTVKTETFLEMLNFRYSCTEGVAEKPMGSLSAWDRHRRPRVLLRCWAVGGMCPPGSGACRCLFWSAARLSAPLAWCGAVPAPEHRWSEGTRLWHENVSVPEMVSSHEIMKKEAEMLTVCLWQFLKLFCCFWIFFLSWLWLLQ